MRIQLIETKAVRFGYNRVIWNKWFALWVMTLSFMLAGILVPILI
jgi:hypothetical protein